MQFVLVPRMGGIGQPSAVQLFSILYIKSLRPSVCPWRSSGPSRTDDRARPGKNGSRRKNGISDFDEPGPARHSRTLGFPPTGPAVGGAGPGPSQKAGRLCGPLHGWNGHGRSLVPSTGGAWPGGGALRCCRREKRRRRTEERREEEKRRENTRGPETQVLRAKCRNTRHGRIVSDRHGYPLEQHSEATTLCIVGILLLFP